MYLTIIQQLGIALVLATLVGLERERKYQLYDFHGFGGVRTFALIGLMGALSYLIGHGFSVFFSVITAGFLLLVITSYYVVAKNKNMTGATSELAAILVYIIGVLAAREEYMLATSVALIVLAALHFKDSLHKWAKHLKNEEVVSTIEFMIIAFVVLPLLPNEAFGPYGFFNPYIVWLMVVFISAISFASYIAVKVFGQKKGIWLSGFLGGLISSTALTLTFSGQSKKNKKIVNPYVVAVIVASSAMFFRVLFEMGVLNREFLTEAFIPIVTMGITGTICTLYFLLRKEKTEKSEKEISRDVRNLKSPFSLRPALKFGAFFAVILFLSDFLQSVMGDRGLYLTSLVSGIMDVDAITVYIANSVKDGLQSSTGMIAVTIAAMTNTFAKAAMFMFFGSRQAALKVAFSFALILLAGGVSLFLTV